MLLQCVAIIATLSRHCQQGIFALAKTPALGFRVLPDMKDALQRAAKADHRSVSSLIEKVMLEWLTREGFMGGEKPAARKRGSRQ